MERNKKDYIDITSELFYKTFDDMIDRLQKDKEKGKLVRCNFNGHTFFSDNISISSAYMEYYDMTKKEKQYYEENRDKITLELLSNVYTSLIIPDELYRSYSNHIIDCSTPEFLQIHYLVIKSASIIISNIKKHETIDRISLFNKERKQIAKDFIEEYIDKKYKEIVLDTLGLIKTKSKSL